MAVEVTDWDDLQGVQVFKALDPYDLIEAELVRGQVQCHYGLYADWRMMNAHRVLSVIATVPRSVGCTPFAVLGLNNTGQAGVADAALLARSHKHFRRPLAELGILIRQRFPEFCAQNGIRRIEARSWAGHPTAGRFLRACGFHLETTMTGFGLTGDMEFQQYAWTSTNQKEARNVRRK